jgi:MoaA/NifB/PqqE/SkfB family radical SAM enzyme
MNAVLDRLPILILEPHNRCNCRCVMCDIWKVADSRELSVEELQRHAADIAALGVEWVVFTGGEPLMHSDLFRLAAALPAGIRTTLLSTGLLLQRYAEQIVAHLGDVIVSLDGPRAIHDAIRRVPGAFDALADGVRSIQRLKPDYPVAARCTVQRLNAGHLRETVGAARELGLASISFLAADLTSTAFNRAQIWPEPRQEQVAPDAAVLEREMEELIASEPPDGFVLEPPAKLRRIVEHFHSPKAPRCNAPWVSAVWEPNGDVRPCFFHPPVGNTAGSSLSAVINSPQAVAFRESLDVESNSICRQCVCSLYYRRSEGS